MTTMLKDDPSPQPPAPIGFVVARGPTPEARQANLMLAAVETAELMKDLIAALMAPVDTRTSKLAGVAAGMERAATRIRANLS